MGYLPGIFLALKSENELSLVEFVLLGFLVFFFLPLLLNCFFGLLMTNFIFWNEKEMLIV